jgi:hypothetical protein
MPQKIAKTAKTPRFADFKGKSLLCVFFLAETAKRAGKYVLKSTAKTVFSPAQNGVVTTFDW